MAKEDGTYRKGANKDTVILPLYEKADKHARTLWESICTADLVGTAAASIAINAEILRVLPFIDDQGQSYPKQSS